MKNLQTNLTINGHQGSWYYELREMPLVAPRCLRRPKLSAPALVSRSSQKHLLKDYNQNVNLETIRLTKALTRKSSQHFINS